MSPEQNTYVLLYIQGIEERLNKQNVCESSYKENDLLLLKSC